MWPLGRALAFRDTLREYTDQHLIYLWQFFGRDFATRPLPEIESVFLRFAFVEIEQPARPLPLVEDNEPLRANEGDTNHPR